MNAKYLLTVTALLFANIAVAQSVMTAHMTRNDQPQAVQISNPVQSITRDEAKSAGIALIVENFDKIDTNHDGIVTRAELRSYLLANRRHVPMT